MLANFLSVLSLASLVASHGVVTGFYVDGTRYAGPPANSRPNNMQSPVRQVSTFNPNYGANTAAINCGPNARFANQVVNVRPGARVGFDWRTGGGAWPHNAGPMISYIAKCNGDCRTYNTSNAQWAKIHYAGFENGQWIQARTVYTGAPGGAKPFYFNMPANIAPGGYILRHEIIALHLASARRQAEFYPACIQINITGNGRGAPAANELVRLPGAYSDDDPGIWCRRNEQFSNGANYRAPGPPVSRLAVQAPATQGGGSTPPANNNTTTPPPANVGSGPKCTVNKRRSPAAKRLRKAKRDHAKRRASKRVNLESSA